MNYDTLRKVNTALLCCLAFLSPPPKQFSHCLFAAESATPPANPSDKQVLERWTPNGNTNSPDLPYRHRVKDYERETDADWVDGRWQETDWGPFITHSTEVAGQPSRPKNIVLFLNREKSAAAMFDLNHCGIRTIARDAKFEIDPARFGLLRKPKLKGDFQVNIAGEAMWSIVDDDAKKDEKPATVSYRGLRLCGNNVLLEYSVGDVPVSETLWQDPSTPMGTVLRQLEIGPAKHELSYQISSIAPDSTVSSTDRGEVIRNSVNTSSIQLVGPNQRAKFTKRDNIVRLTIPAHDSPMTITVSSWQGTTKDSETLARWMDSFQPKPFVADLRKPGEARWGKPLEGTKVISTVTNQPYVIDDFPIPNENPFKALFFCSSVEFFKDGAAAVCTAHGDVWIVRGLNDNQKPVTWQRFATGLFQPLGLKVIDEKVIVLGNDQMTRLHDLNGDGEADLYESLNHDLKTFGQDHAYAMRLETDAQGQFYFLKAGAAPHGSSLYKLSKDTKHLEPIATGFRHPFGMGVGPDGQITVADNEGNWVPSSKIDLITPGGFYGFQDGGKPLPEGTRPLRPLCFIPKVADNASGGQIWATSDRWGDYHRNGMLHFSWGHGTMHAVLEQKVKNVHQAATVEFPHLKFSSGPADAAFNPIDGQLYVVGLDGWQTCATRDGCLSRVRYTGQPVNMPTAFEAHENGILVRFTSELDAHSATKRENYRVNQWNYKWTHVYGSYHYSVKNPDVIGHDGVAVDCVNLLPDGKSVFLHIRDLKPVDQIHVHTDVRAKDDAPLVHDIYGTINAVAEPYQLSETDSRLPFEMENLVAWCIVPFDAKNRGPEERVEMLKRLGIRRIAYDWRDHHIAQFDKELSLYKQNNIDLTGFWVMVHSTEPLKESNVRVVIDALERNKMRTQLWLMMDEHLFQNVPVDKRIEHAGKILRPLAEKAQQIGCCIGLYNHGGWFGGVEHQIEIIKRLERDAIWNVGIVYNLHHAHHELNDFPTLLNRMRPYLYALNLNGMNASGAKILAIGQGDDDQKILQTIKDSGYRGRLGILNHQENVDAEVGLKENLEGLERLKFLDVRKSR